MNASEPQRDRRSDAAAVLDALSSLLRTQPGRGAADYADQVQRIADELLPAPERGEWHSASSREHRAELSRLLLRSGPADG